MIAEKDLVQLSTHYVTGYQLKSAQHVLDYGLKQFPDHPGLLTNYCIFLDRAGRYQEADYQYQALITRYPDLAEAQLSYAFFLLKQGRRVAGFEKYEWRKQHQPQDFKMPSSYLPWQGQREVNLVVRLEQGFGDYFLGLPYLVYLGSFNLTGLVVHAPKSMEGLVAAISEFQGLNIRINQKPPANQTWYFVHHLSLPFLMGLTESQIENRPTLHIGKPKTKSKKPKIGFLWQGKVKPGYGHRSVGFLPLFSTLTRFQDQFDLICLQLNPSSQENKQILANQISNPTTPDFKETASAINQLDLVIGPDTSVTNLALMLGCPTWVLLSKNSDFRWGTDLSLARWFPKARLFRQDRLGDWSAPLTRLSDALAQAF